MSHCNDKNVTLPPVPRIGEFPVDAHARLQARIAPVSLADIDEDEALRQRVGAVVTR